MNIQRMQLALEFRNPMLQFVSTIGMEKHISESYTLKMATEISSVSLVLTDEATQKNFQLSFILYSRKPYIPMKIFLPTYQTGWCCNPYDLSVDISYVLHQIEISASVK
jgi:hypothetical protein